MYPQCRPASPLWSYSAVRFLAAGSIIAISFFRLTYTLLWSTSKELQVFSAKSEVVPNFASVQSKMSPMFKDNITHLAERAAANELIIAKHMVEHKAGLVDRLEVVAATLVGSGHPYGVDGLGGGRSSTNKSIIVSGSTVEGSGKLFPRSPHLRF